MTQLFALVLTICSTSTDCIEVINGTHATFDKCDQVIYEERYFNAECRPVDIALHPDGAVITKN